MNPELYKIYEDNKSSLSKYVHSILKDEHMTNDIIQELYVRLAKQDVEKVKTHCVQWLYTVSRNLSIKVYNKRKRFVELDEQLDSRCSEDVLPFEKMQEEEKLKQLKKILSKLSPKHKKIIKYRYYSDYSYEQIAQKMNLTSGNVGFILHMAVAKIKKEFSKINKNNQYA
jgi:RNA polymerase sigma factor (sigma-70 family)